MSGSGQQDSKTQKILALKGGIPVDQNREIIVAIMERVNQIAEAEDSSGVIYAMLDLMIEITQAESANYFQLDPHSDEYVFSALRGDPESQYLVGLRLKRHQVLPGISFSDSQPVVVGDLSSNPIWLRTADPGNAAQKRNVINLPVVKNNITLGIVQIFNYRQATIDILQAMARRLAIEITHRSEIEATQRSRQRFINLIDIIGQIAGTLDRSQLLHLVTENASRLVGAERSSIFLVDPVTSDMIFQVGYRSQDQESAKPSPSHDSISKSRETSKYRLPQSESKVKFKQDSEFSFFNRSAITAPLQSKPLAQNHAVDRKHILGGLMVHNMHDGSFQDEDAELIHILANQTSTFLQVAEMYESSGELFLGAIKALAAAIDAKDPYTQGHSQRVSDYATLISQELGLAQHLIDDIKIGSLLHDIGKIGIPDAILLKEGKLTTEEYEVMKVHPVKGVNILKQVDLLDSVIPAIAEHHERPDGSGYPDKLTGRQISIMGRIVAVADVFDAMTSDRPYRQSFSVEDVLSYLKENTGNLFDYDCVYALQNILSRTNEISQS